eukprot:c19755_g1_i1 orf=466-2559(-)
MPASMSNEVDIQWGTIKDSGNKARILYSSFFSEGVEYKLYDNVEVYSADHSEPYIGKIMKLWEEKESGLRKVLIRWFFKLRDLDPDMEGDPRELYLAFGKGKGVTNENDLEVICGKCKVLCTSKDVRNRQPSASDLDNTDFFFSKIYNVDLQHLSPVQRIVDKLGCEAVYNKQEWVTDISKNKNQAGEQFKAVQISQGDATVKQEAQCMGSSQPDSKDRQGDLGMVFDTQQKACQGPNVKRHQTSTTDETLRNKKLKTSASTSPSANAASASRFQETEKVSSLGEAITSKISADSLGLFGPPIKVDEQEEHSKRELPFCALSQIRSKTLNLEKVSPPGRIPASETTLPKVDDVLGHQVVENSSRQTDETGRLDQNRTKEAWKDAQESKEGNMEGPTKSLRWAGGASGLAEEGEKKWYEKSEINKSVSTLKLRREAEGIAQAECKIIPSLEKKSDLVNMNSSSLLEPGNSFKGSVVKEARSDVTKRPNLNTGTDMEKKLIATPEPVKTVEKRKIFKELPWEENLQQGILYGKVLLLQNFDPFLTSVDVRDMLKNILQGVSDARIIPQETTCPYGQALAIFDSKLLADSALQEMERKCLVVANNKRPIIASKVKETSNLSRFPGHLALEKLKLSRNLVAEEYKKAVSTSHCSQPNTIEYEMAMEWRRLQEIIQTCRVELFEKQKKEIEEIRKGCTKKGC